GIERRRPDRLACCQVEPGVMPRAAYGAAHDQALVERPAVMRALRAEGAQLAAASRDQHVLVPDVAAQHAALGHRLQGYACRQVRTRRSPFAAHALASL